MTTNVSAQYYLAGTFKNSWGLIKPCQSTFLRFIEFGGPMIHLRKKIISTPSSETRDGAISKSRISEGIIDISLWSE